jgi:hypothetical protein
MNDRRSQPRLCVQAVPWSISASAAFLRISWRYGQLVAEFVAYYKQFDVEDAEWGCRVEVATPPTEFAPRQDSIERPFRLVRLTFQHAFWVRVSPAFSDTQIIDEAAFDWTQVRGAYQSDEGIEEYLRRTQRPWLESGVCPNPCFYSIDNSAWMREACAHTQEKYHHFILLGSEEYVEVIAKSWSWLEGQPV